MDVTRDACLRAAHLRRPPGNSHLVTSPSASPSSRQSGTPSRHTSADALTDGPSEATVGQPRRSCATPTQCKGPYEAAPPSSYTPAPAPAPPCAAAYSCVAR
eukprot:4619629-Pleurochrysis_carterae.AAC.2